MLEQKRCTSVPASAAGAPVAMSPDAYKTVQAIKDVQRRLGLPVTGNPGMQVLAALRKG